MMCSPACRTGAPFAIELDETLASGSAAALLMLDLDGFKGVNDALGHLAGDDLLRIIAVRLAGRLPAEALLARLGGDEFAVLLAGCRSASEARRVGLAALEAFADDFAIAGHQVRLSTSVGFALAPLHAEVGEELMLRADLALFAAKRSADGVVRMFDRALENKLTADSAFKSEIREATLSRQWLLHYQPQVDMATGAPVGAEALLRWQHPSRGRIAPRLFLEVLERHAMADEVGRWVLSTAVAELARVRAAGIATGPVGVNLFASQLRAPGIERVVLDVLERHGLVPADLILELTETIALRQDARCLDELQALRRAGVRLAFDDFGTGFASLTTLRRFAVDMLKIDRSFVADVVTSAPSRAIVGGVVHLARELGLELVVEGVETSAQRVALVDLGCSVGQGYLWGRPAPSLVAPCTRRNQSGLAFAPPHPVAAA